MIARIVADGLRRSLRNAGFPPAVVAPSFGIAFGVLLAFQQAPMLDQLQPGDPATWALTAITIVAATALAAMPSALRAARVAPHSALRVE